MSISWVTLARPFAAQRRALKLLVRAGQRRGGFHSADSIRFAELRAVQVSWGRFVSDALPKIRAATTAPPLCDACVHWNVMDGKGGWCDLENQWCTHARSLRGGCRPAGDKFEEREK